MITKTNAKVIALHLADGLYGEDEIAMIARGINAARARVRARSKAKMMKPIETAPKDGSVFLGVWLKEDGTVDCKAKVRYFEDDDCLTNEDYEITWFADPTHWEEL